MVAGALAALVLSLALLVASLFRTDGLSLVWASLATDLMAVVKSLTDALQGGSADPQGDARNALTALDAGLEKVTTAQTVVGARLSWIDLTAERRTELSELRAGEQETIGAPDIGTTIARLQNVMLVLDASQASFTKLANLSLFNRLG